MYFCGIKLRSPESQRQRLFGMYPRIALTNLTIALVWRTIVSQSSVRQSEQTIVVTTMVIRGYSKLEEAPRESSTFRSI